MKCSIVPIMILVGACSSDVASVPTELDAGSSDASALLDAGTSKDTGVRDSATLVDAGPTCGVCPANYTCGTANGKPVCRAPSGIPTFTHVFVVVMENTSQKTLSAATNAPNIDAMRKSAASSENYHGVAHPSLPNYIALVSGDTQGIACDCKAEPGHGTCSALTCNKITSKCSCAKPMTTIADQLETANKTWKAFGEGMGAACTLTDDSATKYAVRHVPFLYDSNLTGNPARCRNVADFTEFDPTHAAHFSFLAPNLTHDMHDPFPASSTNVANGDAFLGPLVASITASKAYTDGGLLVVVWDEDDLSGGISNTDNPIPMFVFSPFAESGGFSSSKKLDHYSLLATIEDGLGLPRLGKATGAEPLSEFFPAL